MYRYGLCSLEKTVKPSDNTRQFSWPCHDVLKLLYEISCMQNKVLFSGSEMLSK